jgi:hypothetical protein
LNYISEKGGLMGFLGLCKDDELVNTLRDVFIANILRIPEERIQPLCVIAKKKRKVRYWGKLSDLVRKGSLLQLDSEDFTLSPMSNLSGKKSKQVETKLGLKILEGFLDGFGLPSSEIRAQLKSVSKVSFSFRDVKRKYIDPTKFGKLLRGISLDRKNRSNEIFLSEGYDFIVIDSIITSSDFSIKMDEKEAGNASINIEAIKEVAGKFDTGMEVSSLTGLDLYFKGPKHLTFAFSCVLLKLNPDGIILSITPEHRQVFEQPFRVQVPSKVVSNNSIEGILLTLQPTMLSWDDT